MEHRVKKSDALINMPQQESRTEFLWIRRMSVLKPVSPSTPPRITTMRSSPMSTTSCAARPAHTREIRVSVSYLIKTWCFRDGHQTLAIGPLHPLAAPSALLQRTVRYLVRQGRKAKRGVDKTSPQCIRLAESKHDWDEGMHGRESWSAAEGDERGVAAARDRDREESGGGLMPLTVAEEGRTMHIKTILGGHGLRRRLTNTGLVPGMEIRVIRNTGGGPLVVGVLGARIMVTWP